MTTYKNPWHKPLNPMYGPMEYETSANPVEYGGFLIYERISGICFDVVKDGTCVTQLAGPTGARRAIDKLNGTTS